MPKNHELDSLKFREQDAFQHKQDAFQKYVEARKLCDEAYNAMQSAWKERSSAREEMNREYASMQRDSENYRAVWDEYGHIRDANNPRIESLRYEADREHEMMKDCFDRASAAYEYGDKSEAPMYASEGHEHKERRNNINEEVKRLCQEVKSARQNAEWKAPKPDSSAFHKAKEVFEHAKARHESAQAEFKRKKTERDRLKAEFDSAQKTHARLKEEFQGKLKEVKANNKRERDRILDKADIRWPDRDDAKIVTKADGTTQVYHGGIGGGDGYGHGHTALDPLGNKTYERNAFAEHGYQNFVDDGNGITIYERNARKGHNVKGISGGIKLHGGNWYSGKKAGVIGHSTQFYDDGVRISRDTKDGVHEENVHWTDERLPDNDPNKHQKPND